MRHRAEDRRALLLDAATVAIRRHGFDGVTVRRVAREAAVSPGLVHHYFATFSDLLAAAFERAAAQEVAQVDAALASCPSDVERLDLLVASYLPRAGDPSWLLWIDAWGAAARHAPLRAIAANLTLAWTERFGDVLRTGAASGALRCPDPAGAARHLVLLVDGLATQLVALETLDEAEVRLAIARVVAAESGLPVDRLVRTLALGTPAP